MLWLKRNYSCYPLPWLDQDVVSLDSSQANIFSEAYVRAALPNITVSAAFHSQVDYEAVCRSNEHTAKESKSWTNRYYNSTPHIHLITHASMTRVAVLFTSNRHFQFYVHCRAADDHQAVLPDLVWACGVNVGRRRPRRRIMVIQSLFSAVIS